MLERGLKSSNFGKGRAGSLTASCVGSVYLLCLHITNGKARMQVSVNDLFALVR